MSYLINSSHGPADLERASVPFIVANAAAAKGDARMFLTSDALHLAVKGKADDLGAPGYPPMKALVEGFTGKGGVIWICKACAEAMGITPDDLIDGARIGGAADTMAFVEAGGRVLI